MVRSDVYECPWNMLYHKRHVDHLFLISEYKNKIFTALDPYFTEEKLYINQSKVCLKKYHLSTFQLNDVPRITFKHARKILASGVNKYLSDYLSIENKRDLFIKAIHSIDIVKELEGSTSNYDVLLFRKLKDIEHNRLSYLEMLKKIDTIYRLGNKAIEREIFELALQWKALRMLLIKCAIRQTLNGSLDKLKLMIEKIFIREAEVARYLFQIYKT